MQKVIVLVTCLCQFFCSRAQFSAGTPVGGSLHVGAGYVYDFPGMTGVAEIARYQVGVTDWLRAGAGLKRIVASGHPRTAAVTEFTRATTLDVSLLAVPYTGDHAALLVGLGYTFSFYHTRRAYPDYGHDNQGAVVSWPVTDTRGRAHGTTLEAEYEYYFNDIFSAGCRVSVCKAYDGIVLVGPVAGIRF